MMQTIKVEGEECDELRVCFEDLDRAYLQGSCALFLFFYPVHGFSTCGGEVEMWGIGV